MWYYKTSKDSDVVISTRVRYARNIKNKRFPNEMNEEEFQDIYEKLSKAINKNEYSIFKLSDLDDTTILSLVEEHLISKEFANINNMAGIIINKDNTIVTMINEEDHLRIQSFDSGLNIQSCYNRLKSFSDNLEENIDFAKSDKYGYLTACPTNVGSAMRVSVMVHLPALAKLGILGKLMEDIASAGFSIRGLYGENTQGYGHIYQISNKYTLGVSEEEIILKMQEIINLVIIQERKARNILKESSIYLLNEVYRAYGILKNARIISDDESLKLLSKLRLGVAMGLVKEVSLDKVQMLMINTKPNTLKLILKEDLDREEEDIKRGEYIRKEIE